MSDVTEARKIALRLFLVEHGGFARVVEKYGLTQSQASYLSQLTAQDSAASFGERSAKNWEERLKITDGRLVNAGHQVTHQPVSNLSPAPTPGEPTVMVPVLANAGSMGGGIEALHDDVMVGALTLSESWVVKYVRPTRPNALRFIHGFGDSMSPTFEDGDILLVDTGVRDPQAIDGVYVLAANDRLYIKRVRCRMDGAMEVSSDNVTVKTVDVLTDGRSLDVLGRVVWCWNGRKL